SRPRTGNGDFRLAGQAAEQFLIHFQHLLVIVQQQQFMSQFHRYAPRLKRVLPQYASGVGGGIFDGGASENITIFSYGRLRPRARSNSAENLATSAVILGGCCPIVSNILSRKSGLRRISSRAATTSES